MQPVISKRGRMAGLVLDDFVTDRSKNHNERVASFHACCHVSGMATRYCGRAASTPSRRQHQHAGAADVPGVHGPDRTSASAAWLAAASFNVDMELKLPL